jgi:hypothetical protein
MEDWVTIRDLKKKNPSLGTRAIGRLVGVSRSTVKKALGSEQYPGYSRDKKVSGVIEPFQESIKECYLIKKRRVSVILENLRSKGFTGSGISLYRYIGQYLKPQKGVGKPSCPTRPCLGSRCSMTGPSNRFF